MHINTGRNVLFEYPPRDLRAPPRKTVLPDWEPGFEPSQSINQAINQSINLDDVNVKNVNGAGFILQRNKSNLI